MAKKNDIKRCFVCDKEVNDNIYGFMGVRICGSECKYIYFNTDDREIIKNRNNLKKN